MSREAGFVVGADGEVVPVVTANELPPHASPLPLRYAVGDWVAPLPGHGRDTCPAGRVERAEGCAGLDGDQVVMVLPPGGMPYMLKGTELYRPR